MWENLNHMIMREQSAELFFFVFGIPSNFLPDSRPITGESADTSSFKWPICNFRNYKSKGGPKKREFDFVAFSLSTIVSYWKLHRLTDRFTPFTMYENSLSFGGHFQPIEP